jgi:hypothetical protein
MEGESSTYRIFLPPKIKGKRSEQLFDFPFKKWEGKSSNHPILLPGYTRGKGNLSIKILIKVN